MKCAICKKDGATNHVSLVTPPEGEEPNVHEAWCSECLKRWEASVNFRLFHQHVKEGRDGVALSEVRNWQACQRVLA